MQFFTTKTQRLKGSNKSFDDLQKSFVSLCFCGELLNKLLRNLVRLMKTQHDFDFLAGRHNSEHASGAPMAIGLFGDACHLTSQVLVLALFLLLGACSSSQISSDAIPAASVQVIQNKGSDTIVNLALAWAEAYVKTHPDIRISVTGGGSGTGLAAMINGTVDIANASREMKPEEYAAARANGQNPTEFIVARDAIAIVVHPTNPVNGLTLQQVSEIYTGKITNWRQVGGKDSPIVLLSRESNSGTYTYMLENVIRMGESKSKLLFSPETLLMPSSEGISTEVRHNPHTIGYDGLGYVTTDQKVLGVARDANSPYVQPSAATVNSGAYPISRPLYMYTAQPPSGKVKELMNWILSEGQILVSELGFVPLH